MEKTAKVKDCEIPPQPKARFDVLYCNLPWRHEYWRPIINQSNEAELSDYEPRRDLQDWRRYPKILD
jgi:prolyl oligopeptidase PreP (S9A serine peptidase family)